MKVNVYSDLYIHAVIYKGEFLRSRSFSDCHMTWKEKNIFAPCLSCGKLNSIGYTIPARWQYCRIQQSVKMAMAILAC